MKQIGYHKFDTVEFPHIANSLFVFASCRATNTGLAGIRWYVCFSYLSVYALVQHTYEYH